MRRIERPVAVMLLAVGFVFGWFGRGETSLRAQNRPSVRMMHVFTDASGKTRAEQLAAPLMRSSTPPDRGRLDGTSAAGADQMTILRTSGDYLADFHPVSTRRYVVMLSGEREYEVADGQRFTVGPGDVVLVEDLTGTGHATSGTGGDSVNMLVTLSDAQ